MELIFTGILWYLGVCIVFGLFSTISYYLIIGVISLGTIVIRKTKFIHPFILGAGITLFAIYLISLIPSFI